MMERLVPQEWHADTQALLGRFEHAAEMPYPSYPPQEDRLYIPKAELLFDDSHRLIIPFSPDKPYTLNNHPDNVIARESGKAFADEGQRLSDEQGAAYRQQGYEITDRNLPLHPLWEEMITNPQIGVVDSVGYYWQPGLNETSDTIALAPVTLDNGAVCLHSLFVVREDTGQDATPGGDVDEGETQLGAALRETEEEAGQDLSAAIIIPLDEQIVADPRTTLIAGARTKPYACILPALPEVPPRHGAETTGAQWRPITPPLLDGLFASHNLLVMQAVRAYEEYTGMTVLADGSIVPQANYDEPTY